MKCESCNDTGFWMCDECYGEGYFEEEDSSGEVIQIQCRYCAGEGMVPCLDCEYD